MIGQQLREWADTRGISNTPSDRNAFVANSTEELGEWLNAWDIDDEHEKVDALSDLVVFAMVEMCKLNYDPDKVLQETYKEINSRTGAWDNDIGKWVKFKTPEAKALWYKADYTDCKQG